MTPVGAIVLTNPWGNLDTLFPWGLHEDSVGAPLLVDTTTRGLRRPAGHLEMRMVLSRHFVFAKVGACWLTGFIYGN